MVNVKWTRHLTVVIAAIGFMLLLVLLDMLWYVALGPGDPLRLNVAVAASVVIYVSACLYGPFLFGDYLEIQYKANLSARAPLVVPLLGCGAAPLLIVGSYLLNKPLLPPSSLGIGAALIWLGVAFLSFAVRCTRIRRF